MRHLRLFSCAALAWAVSACFTDVSNVSTVTLSSHVTDWRDEMIYQVLVDRFSDGDPGNDFRLDRTSLARYQGGDWQGIINHLDYFAALGVTTLWISPIVRNVDSDSGIDGYHGYWASDLAELNPHFGDLTSLRSLVAGAHQRNMKVVLDIVVNHMGQMFYYDINQNGIPDVNLYGDGPANPMEDPGAESDMLMQVSEYDPPYNTLGVVQSFTSAGPSGPAPVIFLEMPDIFRVPPGWDRTCDPNTPLQAQPSCNSWQEILAEPAGYHRRGAIITYAETNDVSSPEEQNGDFPGGLKDVDTENPAVQAAMIQAYSRWVELTDLDGFRIDTLKHVPHAFWQIFAPAVRERLTAEGKTNFMMYGESFDGDDLLDGPYTDPGEMDSVVYFSEKYSVFRDIFQCEGPTQAIQDLYQMRYPPAGSTTPSNYGTTPQMDGVTTAAPRDLLINFLDNHDVPRFLAGDLTADPTFCPLGRVNSSSDFTAMQQKLYAALAYMYTEDGIPCLYYGTEQDFHGQNDPSNREVLWETATDYATNGDSANDFPTSGTTFQTIARLTRIRAAYTALRRGVFDIKWVTTRTATEEDAGMLAFERNDAMSGQIVLVVINAHTASMSHTAFNGTAMATDYPEGTQLTDVLATRSPRTYTVGAGGTVTVALNPWEAVILVPLSQVQTLMP